MTAAIRQCVILAGGMATRLGAISASTPKPILPCADRPFLAWLMREMLRFGVNEFLLLTGHLSEQIRAALPEIVRHLPIDVRITCAEEPVRAGTGGALFHAREHLQERFLLCNGDSLLDCNLARLLADNGQDVEIALRRIVLRRLPDASRYGVVEVAGDRITAFRERPEPGSPGLINAGIYVFRRSVVEYLQPVCSLERDVMPRLAADGRLCGTECSGYFIDIGIPEDLRRAQAELPARLHRPALLLDRDVILNVSDRGVPDGAHWIANAVDAVRLATDAGMHMFVVPNEAAAARGGNSQAETTALHDWMADVIRTQGGTIEAFCRLGDGRKAESGMILDLLQRWEVARLRCVLVSNKPADLQAAAAAGIRGHLFAGGSLLESVRPLVNELSTAG